MSLYQTLKDEQLAKRKSAAVNPINKTMALTLGTVLAEATRNTKEPTDDEVLKALRKVVAGIAELQKHAFTEERANEEWFLNQWIPRTLDMEQTFRAIHTSVEIPNWPPSLRNMKEVKAQLDVLYPGQVDGKKLSEVLKDWEYYSEALGMIGR